MIATLVLQVAFFAYPASLVQPPPPPPQAQAKAVADEAMQYIRRQMKDPDSAKFSLVTVNTGRQGEGLFVCGFVNAKNSYGGYAGERPFVVTDKMLNTQDLGYRVVTGPYDAMRLPFISSYCADGAREIVLTIERVGPTVSP